MKRPKGSKLLKRIKDAERKRLLNELLDSIDPAKRLLGRRMMGLETK